MDEKYKKLKSWGTNRLRPGEISPLWYHVHPLSYHLHPLWYHLHPLWYHLHPLWYHLHPLWSHAHPLSHHSQPLSYQVCSLWPQVLPSQKPPLCLWNISRIPFPITVCPSQPWCLPSAGDPSREIAFQWNIKLHISLQPCWKSLSDLRGFCSSPASWFLHKHGSLGTGSSAVHL